MSDEDLIGGPRVLRHASKRSSGKWGPDDYDVIQKAASTRPVRQSIMSCAESETVVGSIMILAATSCRLTTAIAAAALAHRDRPYWPTP
jgi:hypothetical protein